ncbi:MAG: preprotein translocase subunit SecG [Bacilli bacterium]
MQIFLMVVAILLISIVLLQSGKAESGSGALTGANDSLFASRKERGGELFITRLTYFLGFVFFVLCLIIGF